MIRRIIITFIIISFLFPAILSANDLFKGLEQIKLDNGLTVLLLRDTTRPIVSVQYWVKAGVWNETPETSGIAHFVEHMLFKGTTSREVNAIQQAIESKGGMINGATSKDFTYYYVNLPSAYWDEALTILTDMMQNASFDLAELEKERLVVLEEIQRQNDEPYAYLWNKFNKSIFKHLPYGMPTLGTAENLKSFTRETLVDFYRAYYKPETMTLVVAGDFTRQELLDRIYTLLLQNPEAKPPIKKPEKTALEPKDNTIPVTIELPFQVNLVYHIVGFLGPTVEDKDQYALDLLSVILGQGRSSRLNQSLHEDQQIVFSVGSSFLTQKANGIFLVDAIYTPNRITEVTNAILYEIALLSTADIGEAEFAKAKRILETSFILENQTNSAKANTLGYYATVAEVSYAISYLDTIAKVQKDDIKRVARKYLGQAYTSVLITPGTVNLK